MEKNINNFISEIKYSKEDIIRIINKSIENG